MSLALRYQAHSEIGLVRKNNQDSAYVSPTMLVVADGMGGAAAGDLASAVAVRELRNVDGGHTAEDMLTALEAAITNAGEQISDLIQSDPALDGMGSTVCGLMFDGTSLGIANIGDSRAYRFADGVLTRLTRDHSWVQTLVDEGRITEAEALEHPHRSLILRVINGQPQHVPDLELAEARAGDRLLICSDGLCGMVTDAAIQAHLTGDREQVMDELVGLAHAAGGQDNITIIVADIVEGERTGEVEVLGSAATLDLEASFDTITAQLALPRDGLEPRPDPVSGESARYSPTADRPRWAWLRLVLAIALPFVLIATGIGLWYSYTRTQYFVGEHDGKVAIFRGLPDQIFGLTLSELVRIETTRLEDLPVNDQQDVQDMIPADSLEKAEGIVAYLGKLSDACIILRNNRSQPTVTPLPSATTSTSPSPKGSPSTSTSSKANPSASSKNSTTPTPATTPSPTPTPEASPSAPSIDTTGC